MAYQMFTGNTGPLRAPDLSGIERAGQAYGEMYKGLGSALGTGIKSYFKGQEEKQMAENMADNPIVMEVVYAGREAPADRGQKIKDIRGVIRASGGYENFLARIDKAKTEQRLVASDKLAQDLANQQKTLFEQGQQLRTENEDLARFLTTRPEGVLAPEGRTAAIQAGRAGRQFDPEVRRGRQDLLSDRFREPTLSPVEAGLPERFRPQAAAIIESDLPPRSKAAAIAAVKAEAAAEQARRDKFAMTLEDRLRLEKLGIDIERGTQEVGAAKREAAADTSALAEEARGRADNYKKLKTLQGYLREGQEEAGLVGPFAGGIDAFAEQYLIGYRDLEQVEKRRKLEAMVTEEMLKMTKHLKGSISEGELKLLAKTQPKMTDPIGVWEDWFKRAIDKLEAVHPDLKTGGDLDPTGIPTTPGETFMHTFDPQVGAVELTVVSPLPGGVVAVRGSDGQIYEMQRPGASAGVPQVRQTLSITD